MKRRIAMVFLVQWISLDLLAQFDGYLDHKDKVIDEVIFPIGFYEHPKEMDKLKQMAIQGINIVHCYSREDLDRAAEAGLLGVVPLPLQHGVTESLQAFVLEVKDHPALAVWEGPDEIIWNITAFSGLYRTQGVHTEAGEWWKQTDNAVQYSKRQAEKILPRMREAVDWIRSVDGAAHPFWMNEALRSDLIYVRQYLDFMDVAGCDIYPVKQEDRRIYRMGAATDRWNRINRGKPVWMVLQAFAWGELGGRYREQEIAYPSFTESRFMAYDVIAHGARGIFYWGSAYLQSQECRQSLYALTAELSKLQPFLTSIELDEVFVQVIDNPDSEELLRGVSYFARRYQDDWLIALVNEDNRWHMAVEVIGLEDLEGQTMYRLYEDEEQKVYNGELLTRIPPYGVQVYGTSRDWESHLLDGRRYPSEG